jgi:hypothetical protein
MHLVLPSKLGVTLDISQSCEFVKKKTKLIGFQKAKTLSSFFKGKLWGDPHSAKKLL